MNLNTRTKRLTLTKTERGYLQKAKSVLDDLARLAEGDIADAASTAGQEIHKAEKLLEGATLEELSLPY